MSAYDFYGNGGSVGGAEAVSSINERATQGNRETALMWSDFGLVVVPIEPGSTIPAVKVLPTSCDRKFVERHWQANPAHVVGCVVGNNLLVACANSPQAQAALQEFERTCNRFPNLLVRTPTGFEHYFWLDKKTNIAPVLTQPQDGQIVFKTGRDIVLLPPHGGKEIERNDACSISDFPSVGQAFVDAVQRYNQSVQVDAVGMQDVVRVLPVQPAEISLAGPNQGGESGESGGLAQLPLPTPVPPDDGQSGESGDLAHPHTTDTTFTAFGCQLAGENAREVPDSATPVAAPLESGQSGVLTVAGPSVALGSFMAIQAAALAAMPALVSDLPVIGNQSYTGDEVFTPKAAENPVVAELKLRGFYQTPLGSGMHRIACPWANEHSGEQEASATYLEPDNFNAAGCFHCTHPHPKKHGMDDVLALLGVDSANARHKPVIRVMDGELDRVLSAMEQVVSELGTHYQYGGMIASVTTNPITGDPSIVPTTVQELTRLLSVSIAFEKYSARDGWVPCDPPQRHVGLLHSAPSRTQLPVLIGVARQPYFREADGVLVTQPGYDKISKLFAVFNPRQFVIPPHPTEETAMAALEMIQELICEFRFANDHDQSAALSAILTATNRSSFALAPAHHVRASVFGSGKSYLCEVFSAFAGPAPSEKVSYPTTEEEATKATLSVLLKNPAVVEYEDMVDNWNSFGAINRMLTNESMTDRILGFSKMATVSTRTLVLGSGNNVGPVRDLLRRVATINLDPRCSTPSTLTYNGNPVETMRKHRADYVAAVLTINLAWKAAGSPRTPVRSIASYGGAWADYCRHPLIWLGLPDPATSLLEQVTHDSDSDDLGYLLATWYKTFRTFASTVRNVIRTVNEGNDALNDALHELPVIDRGCVNPGKLGIFLAKNADRIVGGCKFVPDRADGRKAWAVVVVDPEAAAALFATTGKSSVLPSTAKPLVPEIDETDIY